MVINALEIFPPVDSNGNWLVVMPIRLSPGGIGAPKMRPKGMGWGGSTLTFDVSYAVPVTPVII